MSDATATQHAHDDHEPHIVSWQLLTGVFLILMVLTVLTVAAINVDLGPLNIFIALGIALVKGLFVVFVLMHVLWDRGFHGLLIAVSLGFVALFIGFTMIDTWQYADIIHDQDAAHAKEAANDENPDYIPAKTLVPDPKH